MTLQKDLEKYRLNVKAATNDLILSDIKIRVNEFKPTPTISHKTALYWAGIETSLKAVEINFQDEHLNYTKDELYSTLKKDFENTYHDSLILLLNAGNTSTTAMSNALFPNGKAPLYKNLFLQACAYGLHNGGNMLQLHNGFQDQKNATYLFAYKKIYKINTYDSIQSILNDIVSGVKFYRTEGATVTKYNLMYNAALMSDPYKNATKIVGYEIEDGRKKIFAGVECRQGESNFAIGQYLDSAHHYSTSIKTESSEAKFQGEETMRVPIEDIAAISIGTVAGAASSVGSMVTGGASLGFTVPFIIVGGLTLAVAKLIRGAYNKIIKPLITIFNNKAAQLSKWVSNLKISTNILSLLDSMNWALVGYVVSTIGLGVIGYMNFGLVFSFIETAYEYTVGSSLALSMWVVSLMDSPNLRNDIVNFILWLLGDAPYYLTAGVVVIAGLFYVTIKD